MIYCCINDRVKTCEKGIIVSFVCGSKELFSIKEVNSEYKCV